MLVSPQQVLAPASLRFPGPLTRRAAMPIVCFVFGDTRAEGSIVRGTQLRHIQEGLCRAFDQRFPAMKAIVSVGQNVYDDFGDLPFENIDQEVCKFNVYSPCALKYAVCVHMRMHAPSVALIL